ncbi:MAG TPA: carboxyl transferase domain-containing protein, partial [Catenuloplanes sp.]
MTLTQLPDIIDSADIREPRTRLAKLFDLGTMHIIGPDDGCGVLAATGAIDGVTVIAFATDATRSGGALGTAGSSRIVDAINIAVAERVPVIGIWHSGGALLTEGVTALDGIGRVFSAITRASGRIPQISLVLGPAAGGAAYGPALTDVVIMSAGGRMFVTGPDVV